MCLRVGLAIRLIYAFVVKAGAPLQGDAVYYHGQAKLNLEGHWFVNPIVISRPSPHTAALVPSAQHPPLFTLLLTAGDAVGPRQRRIPTGAGVPDGDGDDRGDRAW